MFAHDLLAHLSKTTKTSSFFEMASSNTSLDAAASERKARLAKLASLKRKQPPTQDDEEGIDQSQSKSPTSSLSDPTLAHLSLRNYDPETRGPRLGFDTAPIQPDQETLEIRASQLAAETKARDEKEEKEKAEGKGIDLFDLQPRKPNWDLKRDLSKKMEVLQQRTDNAIARLVRERLENQNKHEASNTINGDSKDGGVTSGEAVGNGHGGLHTGLQGADLVEGIHVRERQEEEERKGGDEFDDFG